MSDEILRRAAAAQNRVIENFIAQYLADTGARIEDTELVQQTSGGKVIWYCRPRHAGCSHCGRPFDTQACGIGGCPLGADL